MAALLILTGSIIVGRFYVTSSLLDVVPAIMMLELYASYVLYTYILGRRILAFNLYICSALIALSSPLLPKRVGLVCFFVSTTTLLICDRYYEKRYISHYKLWVAKIASKLSNRYATLYKREQPMLQDLILTIMIVEDVARPRFVRQLERVYARIKPHKRVSTGLMQIRSTKPLSDTQSIVKGIKILKKIYRETEPAAISTAELFDKVALTYNGHAGYATFMSYFYEQACKTNRP